MNLNISKTVKAGLLGTFAMTVMMILGPMMGMPKMDMGQMLGPMNPMIPMPYAIGWVLHFVIGIILTGIYAQFLINRLPGDGWKRGMIFSLFPFLVKEIMVSPMMGMGLFDGGNLMMIMGGLMGHLVYGAVIGIVYGDG